MREIYSKAQKTTIWLGEQSNKHMAPEFNSLDTPIGDLIPILDIKLGGNYIDRYDLPALYNAVLQYQVDSAWDERHFILGIIFVRCVNIIMSHEWWKRVWTIQEAVLPPNEPIIWFCGHTFSYGTMVSAIDAAGALVKKPQFSSAPVTDGDLHGRLAEEVLVLYEAKGDESLFRTIHHGTLQRTLLPWMLNSVHVHRATDPRDKIFALESLLTKSEGILINVNYHETTETLFRRITAQCLNQLIISEHLPYRFFGEHHNSLDNRPTGPSWVYDFTHSGAGRRNSTDSTYYRFLHGERNSQPFLSDTLQENITCFASPKVFFCSGLSVGIIDGIFHVQEQIENSAESIRQVSENVIEWWELFVAERRCRNQTMENKTESADEESGALGKLAILLE
ncbi:hypothetical protein F4679DRAFT_144490 [Xylaria curta]|nr:hypothetical protein F4679DRAFT_144490 [Xylaria curta]